MILMTNDWKNKGCIDAPLPEGIDVKAEIRRLCSEKNAVIMAHYYAPAEAQEVASFITPVPGGVGPMTIVSLMMILPP